MRKLFCDECPAPRVFLRFSRYRFKEGNETEGLRILRRHSEVVRSAEGCESVWLGQGQHPSTEFVFVALFRDEATLGKFDGRLRSDPTLGGEMFSLMRLTTQPPEMTQYEVLPAG